MKTTFSTIFSIFVWPRRMNCAIALLSTCKLCYSCVLYFTVISARTVQNVVYFGNFVQAPSYVGGVAHVPYALLRASVDCRLKIKLFAKKILTDCTSPLVQLYFHVRAQCGFQFGKTSGLSRCPWLVNLLKKIKKPVIQRIVSWLTYNFHFFRFFPYTYAPTLNVGLSIGRISSMQIAKKFS